MKGYMSTREVMERLGITRCRVLQLIRAGVLEGEMVGNGYIITEESVLRRLEDNPGPGNPNFGPGYSGRMKPEE